MMSVSEVAEAVSGTLIGKDRTVGAVSIDSRALSKNDLFIAIRGDQFDGHDFVGGALESGAAAAMVERITNVAISQIKVVDSTRALGKLAQHWRARFSIPVVGVTGSNGKTTVTAMIRHILAQRHDPLYPEQSFNNQWGVPLTLLKLSHHSHAVIEMGMNHPGEIDYLAQIASPTIAVINNAAAAHLEGLGDVQQVAMAKGEIIEALSMDGIVILNKDDPFFDFWRRQAGSRKVVTFGLDVVADFTAENIELHADRSVFTLKKHDQTQLIELPISGRHNVMNALAAAAAAHTAGAALSDIAAGLKDMTGIAGRLTEKVTSEGARLIDDSFNANPASVGAAIDVLARCSQRKILVLGAMGELGADSSRLHRETAKAASDAGIDRLLYLNDSGNPDLQGYQVGFDSRGEEFQTVEALVAALQGDNHSGAVILVKGSKSSRMGRVVEQLENAKNNNNESAIC